MSPLSWLHRADRIRLSKCYSLSETMTCLTCHHPHHSVRKVDKKLFNDACKNCHKTEKDPLCSASLAAREEVNNNCVQCHMPPSGSSDIPHINITDHNISIPSDPKLEALIGESEKKAIARFIGLEILTKENPTHLDMARGYIAMYDKEVEAAAILDSAYFYLTRVRENTPIAFMTKVHYYFAKKDYQTIIELSTGKSPQLIDDAWTVYRIGEAYFAVGNVQKSLLFYKQATRLMPLNLDFQEKLGATYIQLQYLPQAQKVFEFILSENPNRERPCIQPRLYICIARTI